MVTHIQNLLATPTHLPVMLVVGDMGDWLRMGRKRPQVEGLFWTDFALLNAEVLGESKPDVVLSPLFSPNFDVLDLAARLEGLCFKGRLRALAIDLPNPAMIRREVCSQSPSIDFDLFILDAQGVNVEPKPKRR